MKVAIVGSRSLEGATLFLIGETVRESGFEITEVVSGGAKGIDTLAEEWAEMANLPIKVFKPLYFKVPKNLAFMAPLKRNKQIAEYCDCLIAIKDLKSPSKGTSHVINEAKKLGKPVFIKEVQ